MMNNIPYVFSIDKIECCADCNFLQDNECFLIKKKIEYETAKATKDSDCPIIDDLSNKIVRRIEK